MVRVRKLVIKLFLMVTLLIITGCGSRAENLNDESDKLYEENYKTRRDKIYDEAFEQFMDPDTVEKLEGDDVFDKYGRVVFRAYRNNFQNFRVVGVVIAVISELIGILLMVFGQKDNKLFKTGLTVFSIGIPLMIIILVFGIGVLNNILLY